MFHRSIKCKSYHSIQNNTGCEHCRFCPSTGLRLRLGATLYQLAPALESSEVFPPESSAPNTFSNQSVTSLGSSCSNNSARRSLELSGSTGLESVLNPAVKLSLSFL